MIATLTPFMLSLGPLALLLAMGVIFAETGLLVGFFLPGDALLFTVGVMAAAGAIPLPLWLIAAGLFSVAVLGDQVGYLIGRRVGPRVFARTDSRFFAASNADRAQAFFAERGPKAIVLARFVPVIRTFTPVVAGVAEMPPRTFTTYNAGGGLVWVVGFLAVGYFLGGVPIIAAHIELFAIAVVALSLIPAAGALVRHRRQRPYGPRGAKDAGSPGTPTAIVAR